MPPPLPYPHRIAFLAPTLTLPDDGAPLSYAKLLGAEKALVQKSGYFARSAAANADDLRLIQSMVDHAVECGLRGESGVVGHDEDRGNRLRAIEFPRVKGGKPFDIEAPWFNDLLREIRQPKGERIEIKHGGEKVPSIPPH